MKEFIFAALPLVLMGLALAVLAVNHMREKQKDEKQGCASLWEKDLGCCWV